MSLPFAYDPNIGSRDSYDEVYTGIWTNHVHGQIYGATLTLNREQGALLIAFLAIFVGTTGKSFWKIVRYGLHYMYSSTKMPDGVYHQRQAILCNTPSALDSALEFVNISWAWRKRAAQVMRRALPSLTLALLVSVGFTCAGIFSSRVAFSDANEVLLSGKQCGIAADNERGNYTAIYPYLGIKLTEYLTYALGCYQHEQPHRLEKCQIYIRSKLPYTVDTSASCPFAKDLCLYQDQNIMLDTGLLDSEKDLGINGGQHFLFRSVRHCAPLVTDGHVTASLDDTSDETKTLTYNYSKYDDEESTYQASVFPVNATADMIQRWVRGRGRDYKIKVMRARGQNVINSDFTPSAQIHRSDASVTLLFLSAPGILYDREIPDPWFSATTPIDKDMFKAITGYDFSGNNYYISEQPATVLGCTSQRYFCNPDLPKNEQCMNIDQEGDNVKYSIPKLWPDPAQRATFYGAMTSIRGLMTAESDEFLEFPGLPALMARFSLNAGKQINIDIERQWQKEMEFTFQANLVSIQASVVEAAKGAFALRNDSLCQPAEACKSICKSQKIRSPRHYSFSVLGVAIILAVGGTIMLIGLFLEQLVSTYSKVRYRKSRRSYAQLEWHTNSILQLQRLAHEGIGAGTWSGALDTVPVTNGSTALGILDVTDEKHTRLIRSEASFGGDVCDMESKPDAYDSVDQAASSYRSISPIPSVHSYDTIRSRYSAVSDVSDEERYSEHDGSSRPPP